MLTENPFATDEQLAETFGVSVATIRLDRQALNIPEVRERIRRVAADRQDEVRALDEQDVVGRIVRLELNHVAISELPITSLHVFARSGIVRGHVLFAQVNSLAMAVMDEECAVTAKTELRFYRPVRLGETLRARIDVVARHSGISKCRAHTEVDGETVLDGWIWVARASARMREGQD